MNLHAGRWLGVGLLLSIPCCAGGGAQEAGWLTGSVDERFEKSERQFRGMDVTMIEVGYRFSELYFAGIDRNWPYARYQLEKLETALELGLERRPLRAGSARPFLHEDLPAVAEALETEDSEYFLASMERLRSGCMRCHVSEDVPFFVVEFPSHRTSVIQRRERDESRD